jgi:hypothetical protein
MNMAKGLKSEIAKRIGVAITVCSFWPLYNCGMRIMAVILIVILVGSCIVLRFREQVASSRWKILIEASDFDITFSVLGLAMITSGARLVSSGAIWWGVGCILAGGFFIGAGIGEGIIRVIVYRRKHRRKTVIKPKV